MNAIFPNCSENGRGEISKPNGNGQFLLDSNGACFLCLKQCPESFKSENEDVTTDGLNVVCWRKICRYLNIDQSVILHQKDDEKIPQENGSDLSVMLCQKCSNLSNKFSQFIEQLEMTRILLKQTVTKFQETLVSSEEKSQRKCGSLDSEARLMKNLRDETKEKCAAKVKQLEAASVPRVQLKRSEVPPKPPSQIIDQEQKTLTICKNILKEVPQEVIIQCSVCKIICQNSFDSNSAHVVDSHPEQFFQDFKLPQISEELFNDHCKQVLEYEEKNAQRQPLLITPDDDHSNSTENQQHFHCKFCNKKFKNSSIFKYHLISKHYEILEEKLTFIQKKHLLRSSKVQVTSSSTNSNPIRNEAAPSPIQNTASSLPVVQSGTGSTLNLTNNYSKNPHFPQILAKHCFRKWDTNQYGCHLCHKPFQFYHRTLILSHLVIHHPEMFFDHIPKPPHLSKTDFISNCKNVLASPLNYQKVGHEPTARNRNELLCAFCKKRFSTNLKYHLIEQHLEILEGKLLTKLQDSNNEIRIIDAAEEMEEEEEIFYESFVDNSPITILNNYDTQEEGQDFRPKNKKRKRSGNNEQLVDHHHLEQPDEQGCKLETKLEPEVNMITGDDVKCWIDETDETVSDGFEEMMEFDVKLQNDDSQEVESILPDF